MLTTVAAQTAQDGVVKVIHIKGDARYMSAGNTTWLPLKIGAVLKPGSVIQTAVGSHVDLVLNNPNATVASGSGVRQVMYFQPKAQHDAIRIFESSVLGIEKLSVTHTGVETITETELDLKAGRIFGSVKKMSEGSKYEVKIPNGVAGIRGTFYFLSAEAIFRILSGSGVLSYVRENDEAEVHVVPAGSECDGRTGRVTPIPPTILDELNRLAQELRKGQDAPVSLLTIDYTLFYLSPTTTQSRN